MDVLILQIFVSLILVLTSVLLFMHAAKSKVHEHADRLALLPLQSDERVPTDDVRPTDTKETARGDAAREEQR